jgi:NitT/TauT family transport system substrate-binding protein
MRVPSAKPWPFLLAMAATARVRCTDEPSCEEVLLQLDWTMSPQFAGILQAVDRGFYAAANLCVDVRPNPGTSTSVVDVVLQRRGVTFGVSEGAVLLQAASAMARHDPQLVAVASMLRTSPLGWMSLGGFPSSVESMRGRKVAIHQDGYIALATALETQGNISLEDVAVISTSDESASSLLNGTVDFMQGYVFEEFIALQRHEPRARIVMASDHGDLSYSEVLFTKASALENERMVAAFVEATRRGWEYAAGHREGTVGLLAQEYAARGQAASRQELAEQLDAVVRLVGPLPMQPMATERWEEQQALLLRYGVLHHAANLTALVHNV